MSNMSYCRFNNTSLDVADCLAAMVFAEEDGLTFEEFRATLSDDEQRALDRMIRDMEMIMEYAKAASPI